MARDYAKVWLRITEDGDFRALSRGPQHLYLMLLLSRTVNNAGVADWRPKRMSVIAKGWTEQQIEADSRALEAGRFIVVDRASEEVLLRSFIRHDGIMAGPKTAQGMASAYRRTTSLTIRAAIIAELDRLQLELTESTAWAVKDVAEMMVNAVRSGYPGSIPQVSDGVSDTPSQQYPAGIPQVSREYPPSLEPKNLSTSKPKSSRSAPPNDPEPDPWIFTEFWEHYPRKVGKEMARKSWRTACKKAHPDLILAAAVRYANDPNLPPENFIPHPATWLNGGRWTDGPLPDRNPAAAPKRSTTDDRMAQNLALVQELAREDDTRNQQRQIGNR